MHKITNIIPILFMGGTGGHFLAYLINSASRKNTNRVQLSEYGNAHSSGFGIGISNHSVNDDTSRIIQLLINSRKNVSDKELICYSPCHITDFELASKFFDKMIRITYTEADIESISLIFVGKTLIDSGTANSNSLKQSIRWSKYQKYQSHFSPSVEINDRILEVSWDELFKTDGNQLINKLSSFTNIPPAHFTLTNLEEWRLATNRCLLTVTQLLN
jgi:hypothetical protein